MAKEVKKTYRLPNEMQEYIEDLSRFLKISANDALKMMLFEYMSKHKRNEK